MRVRRLTSLSTVLHPVRDNMVAILGAKVVIHGVAVEERHRHLVPEAKVRVVEMLEKVEAGFLTL